MNLKQEFIYVLKPREDLLLEENWTEKENEAVDQHFAYLEKLKELGILILAGKTKGMDEKTFGIVVLEAEMKWKQESGWKRILVITQASWARSFFPTMWHS